MASALLALHAISGCDSTSAFYGLGKQKVYKIVKGSDRCKETLAQMGDSFDFNKNLFPMVEEMVAQFYGIKGCTSINDARYMKFYTKSKIPEPQPLPPTKDELLLHCQRANCLTCIWKSALNMITDPPQPEDRGWFRQNGVLEPKWMSQKPAPDSLLEFLSCGCKKSGCQNNMFVCVYNGLSCTDICSCNACSNMPLDIDDVNTYGNFDCDPDD